MTRPRPAAERFVASLPPEVQERIDPLFSPLIRIEPTGADALLSYKEGAIFTSANGVLHGPTGAGRPAFCIGTTTTQAATDHGWTAQAVGPDARSLCAALVTNPPDAPLVHLRGRHTRGDVAATLTRSGLQVREVAVYDQVLCPLTQQAKSALKGEQSVIVPLFSPRTARQFAKEAGRATSCHVIALSPAVAEAAGGADVVVDTPDADAMRSAVQTAVAERASG